MLRDPIPGDLVTTKVHLLCSVSAYTNGWLSGDVYVIPARSIVLVLGDLPPNDERDRRDRLLKCLHAETNAVTYVHVPWFMPVGECFDVLL